MKTKILLSIILIVAGISTQSQIIHVPADQPTIQAGINVASDGDTVMVSDGTYFENIVFKGKAITVASYFLIDQNPDHITNTIINGSQPTHADSASVVMFCYEEDTTSILCGFTITGGTGMYFDFWNVYGGGGIACWKAGAKIIHNIIIDNEVIAPVFAFGGGIACDVNDGEQWIIIEDNLIKNNLVQADGFIASSGGVYIGINARVTNNIIEENHCISASGQADAGGIRLDSEPTLLKTVIFDNNLVRNNTIQGSDAWGGGMVIYKTSCIISNSTISGNSAEAIFDGRGAGIFAFVTQGPLVITGSTISNNSLVSNFESWGAGVSIINAQERIIIENNMIMNNTMSASASCAGAGLLISYPLNPSPITISHNQISGNVSTSSGSFEEGSFGGGVGLILGTESDVIFDGNMIMNNRARSGGGVYLKDVYNIDITNNIFAGDTALSYGGAICFGLPVPSASVDSKNQENPGRETEHPFLANNTFTKNRGFIGGAVYSNNANLYPVIINSIFWENDALDGHDIYQLGSPDLPVYYCDIDTNNITGDWSGEGNINSDPMFLDPFFNNYRIDSCLSQCTNSGIDTLFIEELGWYYAPAFDINGNVRPQPESQQPDIGAYEVDGCTTDIGESKFQVSNFKFQTYPNPSFGISDIRYQIPDIRFVLLEVFDIHGQKIETLANKKQISGDYIVRFDGTGLPAGIYAVKLQVGNAVKSVKLLLVK